MGCSDFYEQGRAVMTKGEEREWGCSEKRSGLDAHSALVGDGISGRYSSITFLPDGFCSDLR
jgi:hypothetical protein